ncbi:hypothetical protein PIB30_035494 [Stylosanthes scabra]|uniref:Uncharacterized protein n=1 Tax=Stylosanthes scabra TaxID=79078 RepID=A0ABU6XB85_9FABA|nr:hypothetical protein [Stylosanthes scabra]
MACPLLSLSSLQDGAEFAPRRRAQRLLSVGYDIVKLFYIEGRRCSDFLGDGLSVLLGRRAVLQAQRVSVIGDGVVFFSGVVVFSDDRRKYPHTA